ncbi:hypothetical protein CSIRO_2864 [Bradyrhizobiaceae bacterium SG-6C]|nr:hypothetical protein CSIRO_2864 [Bradyrhizobiaceae bacterium SG-6C]
MHFGDGIFDGSRYIPIHEIESHCVCALSFAPWKTAPKNRDGSKLEKMR